MQQNNKEFILFIENLRIERNLTREELCENILSTSQFKRYLRGSSVIPNDKLVFLAERLKFNISDLHNLFDKKYNEQYQELLQIYDLNSTSSFKTSYVKLHKLKDKTLISTYNEFLFDFLMINTQYNLNMMSDVQALEMLSELINFPDCKENSSFNFVELNGLLDIVTISSRRDDFKPANILYEILSSNSKTFASLEKKSILPIIHLILAGVLNKQDKPKKVLEISRNGIDICLKHDILNSLEYLYLYKGFAEGDLGETEKAKNSIKKAFMLLYVQDKHEVYRRFKKSYEKNFNSPLEELIQF
ncbi:MAG: helix-turn-helix domain-containing protein [Candidatus Izimaplasma sp.]|nr:helix-turn-helix domain-containing protein [Candidatus Izimaplasma bacterium]